MKKQLLLLTVFLTATLSLHAQSQRELVFYNEEGRNFTVSLNGMVQNAVPRTHVRITNLPGNTYKVKIVFEDEPTIFIKATVNVPYGYERLYEIAKKKNKYQIFLVQSAELYDEGESVYTYSTGMNNDMPGFDPLPLAPMSQEEFQQAKKSILGQSFENDRMRVLKQVVKANCLYTSQVIELAKLFTFDDKRLEVVKLAYPYVFDPQNYYTVNDILTFSSSKEKLDEFINNQEASE